MDTPKKKILIVDDDSFLLDMYALKFTQSGYDVETALGSTIALEKIKGGASPQILLLDIVMPVMDGFELLEEINKLGLLPNTKKIILSNRGAQSDIDKGNQLGVAGYIVKANSTPSEVITKVNALNP
jgi:CheY-like chemotaxis protein